MEQEYTNPSIGKTLAEKFEQWLKDNPTAYPEFCKRVRQIMDRGIVHYSSDTICHVLRFHSAVDGRSGGEAFKINNNYVRCLSRKWQEDHPEHEGFFENRKIKHP